MYGLRKDTDLQFLKGRILQQVAIGSYQVQFAFDADVTISIQSKFTFFDGTNEFIWTSEPSTAEVAARTVVLLGSGIQMLETSPDGRLALGFSCGRRLTIFDSVKDFESYSINWAGEIYII